MLSQYACGADDRDKPAKLREVERGMWSMLLGVAAGAFTAENALVSFLHLCNADLRESPPVLHGPPWFDVATRLKHPKGSQTSSIEVASETGLEKQQIETPSVDGGPSNLWPNEVFLANLPSKLTPFVELGELLSAPGPGGVSSVATAKATGAGDSAPHSVVEESRRRKREMQVQDYTSDDAEDEKDSKVAPRKKAKQKKKSKPKSKTVISSADDESDAQQAPASGSDAVPLIQQRPPRVRLSKRELAEYAQKGATDEDSIWRSTFMEVHRTKGPVMGSVGRPMRTRRRVSPEMISSSMQERPPSPAVRNELMDRADNPVWIDAFSVNENRWVQCRIDCLQASVSPPGNCSLYLEDECRRSGPL